MQQPRAESDREKPVEASLGPVAMVAEGSSPPLALVVELCSALEGGGIRYCHWKSNQALERSASGDNDLDLLVHRSDLGHFLESIDGLGFKRAIDPPQRAFPGVRHYLGLDVTSGKLVDIHLHHQLVLGHDATKNIRLPVEDAYLASVVRSGLFRVPDRANELVLFVIRMVLKHRSWDAILGMQGGLSESERFEFGSLQASVDPERLTAAARELLPFLDERLFLRCLASLESDRSPTSWIRTAGELQRALSPFSRRPPAIDTISRLWRRVSWRTRRIAFRGSTRKHLDSGGAVVALVGGDGAGKSTASDALLSWLSTDLRAAQMHLGKPSRSVASLSVRAAMAAGRSVHLFGRQNVPPTIAVASPPQGLGGFLLILRHALTARDRFRASTRARRKSARGSLVVCDRYPMPQLELMDGSRIPGLVGGSDDRASGFLARIERRYYERISPPDVLVVLRVDPEIAVVRKSEEDSSFVRLRSAEVWESDWTGSSAKVVDAGRSPDEVLLDVKAAVWSSL